MSNDPIAHTPRLAPRRARGRAARLAAACWVLAAGASAEDATHALTLDLRVGFRDAQFSSPVYLRGLTPVGLAEDQDWAFEASAPRTPALAGEEVHGQLVLVGGSRPEPGDELALRFGELPLRLPLDGIRWSPVRVDAGPVQGFTAELPFVARLPDPGWVAFDATLLRIPGVDPRLRLEVHNLGEAPFEATRVAVRLEWSNPRRQDRECGASEATGPGRVRWRWELEDAPVSGGLRWSPRGEASVSIPISAGGCGEHWLQAEIPVPLRVEPGGHVRLRLQPLRRSGRPPVAPEPAPDALGGWDTLGVSLVVSDTTAAPRPSEVLLRVRP